MTNVESSKAYYSLKIRYTGNIENSRWNFRSEERVALFRAQVTRKKSSSGQTPVARQGVGKGLGSLRTQRKRRRQHGRYKIVETEATFANDLFSRVGQAYTIVLSQQRTKRRFPNR